MTHEKKEANLDTAISALRNQEPNARELAGASERIWSQMQSAGVPADVEQIHGCADVRALLPAYRAGTLNSARMLLVRDHVHECVACRTVAESGAARETAWTPLPALASRWGMRQWAVAMAVLVVVGLAALLLDSWYFAAPPGMRAKLQSVSGTAYRLTAGAERALAPGDELAEGDMVRTGAGSHAFLQLLDGSVVEMNERAEFSVSARRHDATVHLDQGSIIVQAAKRRTGHLYVITPDCRIAVTGTVFSVNSGLKGSRVAVIEGSVRVAYAGSEELLHPGEQVATSASMGDVPVQGEIAWSQNFAEHLALLAEFSTLQKKFQQIPAPGLRFASAILPRVPANTAVYATIPNLGQALSDANRIFQEQLQQSEVLRAWWYQGHQADLGTSLDQLVGKLNALSQFLGDEVVLVGLGGPSGGESNAAVLAEVRRPGLADFLQRDFLFTDKTGATHAIRVVEPAQLAAMAPVRAGMLALVRPDFVVFSESVPTLQLLNAQLDTPGSGFTTTDFGQQIDAAYKRGAGFLLAANLQQIIANDRSRPRTAAQQRSDLQFDRTGFADAKYLLVSHRDLSGTPDNRVLVNFAGARHGIASWLAAPAPMGSLEFVSANAGLAISGIAKSPALMVDDLLAMTSGPKAQEELAKFESELNLNLRNDLAAAFGGEFAFALDGPILPTPSWKLIAEVPDSSRLQNAIQQLVTAVNAHAAQEGRPGVQMEQQDADGHRFYTLRSPDAKPLTELHYTFLSGYIIVAPSRALLVEAIGIKGNPENSLARLTVFRSLLPKDGYADFSAVMYQNLAPILQPITSQLNAQQLQAAQQLMANSKPTVICAYGGEARIEVASATGQFPFDTNLMALPLLLGRQRAGTLPAPRP